MKGLTTCTPIVERGEERGAVSRDRVSCLKMVTTLSGGRDVWSRRALVTHKRWTGFAWHWWPGFAWHWWMSFSVCHHR